MIILEGSFMWFQVVCSPMEFVLPQPALRMKLLEYTGTLGSITHSWLLKTKNIGIALDMHGVKK